MLVSGPGSSILDRAVSYRPVIPIFICHSCLYLHIVDCNLQEIYFNINFFEIIASSPSVNMACTSGNVDMHREGLQSLCRVYGRRATNKDCKYLCSKFSDQLLKCFAVDVSSDNQTQYPKFFCKNCRGNLDRITSSNR